MLYLSPVRLDYHCCLEDWYLSGVCRPRPELPLPWFIPVDIQVCPQPEVISSSAPCIYLADAFMMNELCGTICTVVVWNQRMRIIVTAEDLQHCISFSDVG